MNLLQVLDIVFSEEVDPDTLISIHLSGPYKASLRKVLIKGKSAYQLTEQKGVQAFHQNLSAKECKEWLEKHIPLFKQVFFYTTTADYHLLLGRKGSQTILKKKPSKSLQTVSHNRKKEYLIEEGTPVPFLIHLGVMNAEGRVYPKHQDKFRQINRFLEMIDDIVSHFDPSRVLRVVDFGCGKAYLTFALYHFLKNIKGFSVNLVGIDLKKSVIEYCQQLAENLGMQQELSFISGNIEEYQRGEEIDLMVALHACDTATDAALEKGVRLKAKVILAVPCCQHELLHQIAREELRPLLKHGIVKERLASLVTDAARAQLLEVLGYQVQILEFIDIEHTPKNLLIRAVKVSCDDGRSKKELKSYRRLKEMLHIDPSLERRFKNYLSDNF